MRTKTMMMALLVSLSGCQCGPSPSDAGGEHDAGRSDGGASANDDAGGPGADGGGGDDGGVVVDGGGDAGEPGTDAGGLDGGGLDAGEVDGSDAGEVSFDAGFGDFERDETIYAGAPNLDNVVELTEAPFWRIPTDELLILLVEDTPASEAERVAALVEGQIVGAHPGIGLFQVKLATATLEALDAALSVVRADAVVEGAGENPFAEPRTYDDCYPDTDLERLEGDDRCPFDMIGFYAASAMLNEAAPALSVVRVGVVDTGINETSNAFDAVPVLNTDAPGTVMVDADGHGTQVAGMIAADNDRWGVSGVASTLARKKIALVAGLTGTAMQSVAALAQVAGPGRASVVNMSFGYGPFEPAANAWIVNAYRRLFAAHPGVLFVAAAPNEAVALDGTNDAPSGIQLPNVLTVSALERCNPDTRASFAAFGPAVEIMAAGTEVPLVHPTLGGTIVHEDGTSFATPQVTAVAAMVQSLDPSIRGAALKTFLLENTLGSPNPSLPDRLGAYRAMAQTLVDLGAPASAGEWLDHDDDGEADSAGLALARVCGGFTYTAEGFGSHHAFEDDAEETSASGLLSEADFSAFASANDGSVMQVFCYGCTPRIGVPYAIGTDAVVTFIPSDAMGAPNGVAESGSWELESCRVIERDGANAIREVAIVGSGSGIMQMTPTTVGGPPAKTVPFNASHEVTFVILGLETTGPLFDHLEAECEGGLAH